MSAIIHILKRLSKYFNKLGYLAIGAFSLHLLDSIFAFTNKSPAFFNEVVLIILCWPLYFILMPVHELGHYCVAAKYAKGKSDSIKFCLRWKEISCDKWKDYSEEECRDILISGTVLKILACIIIAVIFFASGLLLWPVPLYTAVFEYVGNMCTILPQNKENDIIKFRNIPLFHDEKINMHRTHMDTFIRKWYIICLIILVCICGIFSSALNAAFSHSVNILRNLFICISRCI